MCIDEILSFLFKLMKSKDFSTNLKVKLISCLFSEDELFEKLNLKIVRLIDELLQQHLENADRILIMEMKLRVLYKLDYPNELLIKNNIMIYEILSEYLDTVKCDYVFSKNICQVLNGILLLDGVYSKIISEHLFEFISDDDKIELLISLDKNQCIKMLNEVDNALAERVLFIKRAKERFKVLLQLFIIAHPDKANDCYMVFLIKYNYDNLCLDWYWTKNTECDYYLKNNIISEEESMILYKVGDIISSDNSKQYAMMQELYRKFIYDRSLVELLFPEFLNHNFV